MSLQASEFFNLQETELAPLFEGTEVVWEAIERIGAFIQTKFAEGLVPNTDQLALHPTVAFGDAPIFVGEGTRIDPGVYIEGPAIIGKNCEIRQGAYLRENVILGDGVGVGHATELKNAVMLEGAHAPHFAYLGDSILGRNVNLGAGTKLSNLAVTSTKHQTTGKRPTVQIMYEGEIVDTGLAKFGAILGDEVQLGCNCVTNPGCLVGPRTLVYALVSLAKGYYPADSIIKLRQQTVIVEKLPR